MATDASSRTVTNPDQTDATREERIKDLLIEVLDTPASLRPQRLEELEHDAAMRVAVLDLASAHDQAGGFMSDPSDGVPAADAESTDSDVPEESIIGRYKILQRIGEGGFGTVYLAQQREPVTRQVALKIIKLGMDTRRVIARFEAERQALAVMEHPNIARVFDAGSTASGRPYFVMELVRGVPITEYCEQNQLSIDERLELFMQVCSAVQHAHMKGIIHRDLKPSNVLVTNHGGEPLPKVIDFGIAKATGTRLTDKTLFTEFKQLIGTPEYMSPEQADANATDVDTRTDVYSLGVLLYQLLTGTTPLDGERLRSASFGEMQRMIREEEPPKPSTRLSSTHKAGQRARRTPLRPSGSRGRDMPQPSLLRGDLDWITLKAMEKDRERRYSSAAELAEDVRRHLRNEPVLAGPPSVRYRLGKLIKRRRVEVIATVVIALALVGGSVGTSVGMVRARNAAVQARDAADQAMQINEFMRDVLTSVDPDRGKGADVRLVEILRDASDTVSQRFAGHPQLEAQVRDLLGLVYNKLSMWKDATEQFALAAEKWHGVAGAGDVRTLGSRVRQVQSLANQGFLLGDGAQLDALADEISGALGVEHELWFSIQRIIGARLAQRGDFEQARNLLGTLRLQAQALGAGDEMQLEILRTLVRALMRRLDAAKGAQRSATAEEARPLAKELVARSARLHGDEAIVTLGAQHSVAMIELETGGAAAASEVCRRLLATSSERLGECHQLRVEARRILMIALLWQGEAEAAADEALRRLACVDEVLPIVGLAWIADALPILDRGGKWIEGERYARELVRRLEAIGGGHGPMILDAESSIARFVSLQDRMDEAEAMFAALMERDVQAKEDSHVYARLHRNYGAHLFKRGSYDDAEDHLLRAAAALPDVRHGTWNWLPDDVIIEFIALYEAWGKAEKVTEYQRLREEALAQAR